MPQDHRGGVVQMCVTLAPTPNFGSREPKLGDLAQKDEAVENAADFASRAIVACWDLTTQERVGTGNQPNVRGPLNH
ncbi:hypothetical protein [Streptomyces noursei]|uniref:hypothetical protein n=1 Tax=Streptomyces noursei TaxID=1971 RepID=UPI0037FA88A2